MAVHLDSGTDCCTITLSGAVGVDMATGLYAAAVTAVGGAAPVVVVTLTAAPSVDTSVAQILLALARELTGQGRTLRLTGGSPSVAARLRLVALAGALID
jgi:anti-anti-sigma regulatory factor